MGCKETNDPPDRDSCPQLRNPHLWLVKIWPGKFIFFGFSPVVFIFGNVTVTLVQWLQSPPPNSSSPQAKGFWFAPFQEKGADHKHLTWKDADSSVDGAPDKRFREPRFESLSGQSLFLPSRYMYNPKFRLPTLFQDISKYVSIYFVEPTVYWSSGWSYQGMGHQESPDSHLWPQGSFPGCQENQGLISKNKSYCYNFNACIYPLHVPSPRVVWKKWVIYENTVKCFVYTGSFM